MMIIGLSGGFDPSWRLSYDLSNDYFHDYAAVLPENGNVVAAVEQERLNRIKHTNRSAIPAIRACLDAHGATIEDIDSFAFYATEANVDQVFVHPASHDAGGALGAAIDAHRTLCPNIPVGKLNHLFLGKDIGDIPSVCAGIERWRPLVTVENLENPCATAAQMLANDKVIGLSLIHI